MNSKQFEVFLLLSCWIALQVPFREVVASVGTCSFHMYLYKTRMYCEIPFYQGLRLGLMTTNCSDNFETLISCIKNVTRVCEHSWRNDAWIDLDVRLKFRKQFYCQNGALVVPVPLALCGKNKQGKECLRSFHAKFRNDVSDPTLCNEYSMAKRCIQELLAEECPAHRNSRSYYMDILFDGYNPFCKSIFYFPPTTVTVTTPLRKTEGMVTSQRSEPSKSTPGAEAIIMSNANFKKLSYHIILKALLVSLYLAGP